MVSFVSSSIYMQVVVVVSKICENLGYSQNIFGIDLDFLLFQNNCWNRYELRLATSKKLMRCRDSNRYRDSSSFWRSYRQSGDQKWLRKHQRCSCRIQADTNTRQMKRWARLLWVSKQHRWKGLLKHLPSMLQMSIVQSTLLITDRIMEGPQI